MRHSPVAVIFGGHESHYPYLLKRTTSPEISIYTVEVVLNSYTPLSNDVNLVIICHYIAMMLTTMGIV